MYHTLLLYFIVLSDTTYLHSTCPLLHHHEHEQTRSKIRHHDNQSSISNLPLVMSVMVPKQIITMNVPVEPSRVAPHCSATEPMNRQAQDVDKQMMGVGNCNYEQLSL